MVPKTCSIPECESTGKVTRGLCNMHYLRMRRHGDPLKNLTTEKPSSCVVGECVRSVAGRGMCSMHWARWRTYGDPLFIKPRRPASRCIVSGCGRDIQAHEYCPPHLYHFQTYGDPLAVGPGRGVGRNRLEVPSYAGMHKRLFYDKGKASAQTCSDCGKRAHEWSYDGGCPNELIGDSGGHILAYTVDQSKYSPRCLPCHRLMDESLDRGRDKAGRFAPGPKVPKSAR